MLRRSERIGAALVAAAASALLSPIAAFAAGPGSGGGGGNGSGNGGRPGAEVVGNNLSFPVEWSEAAYQLVLPGTEQQASIEGTVSAGTYTMDDLTPCLGAVQKHPLNVWQAENEIVTPNEVTEIDWGDNLESKDWRAGQVVRVETGLYDTVLASPMLRYEMCYISGSGTTEVWGLRVTQNEDGSYMPVTTPSTEAMVYTGAARLTIQRIGDLGVTPTLVWDAAEHRWETDGGVPAQEIFNSATWQKASDGPGSYGAELNVQGKVVYGYVWNTRGLTAGEYRLTYSLDQAWTTAAGSFVPGVDFAGEAIVRLPVEEVVAEAEGGGNTAYVLPAEHLTYIDVGLTAGGGGGGPRR